MNFLYRLIVLVAKKNLNLVLTLILGTALLIVLNSLGQTVFNFELALRIGPFALIAGLVVTFIVIWPIWILRVRQAAHRKNQTFGRFVRSSAYLDLLADHKRKLDEP